MSEKLYDEVIAPKLREIGELCQKNGVPFVAMVEWEPGQEGRTELMPLSASMAMHITALAARCGNNVDSLFIAIARFCEKHEIDTSRSIVLGKFGSIDNSNARK